MGRRKATGRFDSREELEAFVWREWQSTPRNQATIARHARVSEGTVGKILDNPPPTPQTDEVWVTKDGRHIPVCELDGEHAKNIVRMLIRNRRAQYAAATIIAGMVKRMIAQADAREAEAMQKLHDDIYNDVMEDRKWGSD